MENALTIYDEQLLRIQHYKNHPQMLPFIGKNWGKGMKKVLLIGESHFMRDPVNNSKKWYETTKNELSINQRQDTSPREIITMGYLKKSFGDNRIFSEINTIMNRMSNGEKDILYFSFLNFFQRPAIKKNESFDKLDISIGNEVVKEATEILQPEYIFILSYKAWDRLNIDYDSNLLMELFKRDRIKYSCHPTQKWWTVESEEYKIDKEKGTGKERFEHFIKSILNNVSEI
jgi:hypothetical protein